MSKLTNFEVLREHLGDRKYQAGDTREMVAADAANLVELGVLREEGTKKAEASCANKMEPAPVNKADARREKKA